MRYLFDYIPLSIPQRNPDTYKEKYQTTIKSVGGGSVSCQD